MTDTFEGGCACGSCAIVAPRRCTSHCCHCKDCQRQTGADFVVNAMIEADRVERAVRRPSRPSDADRQRPAAHSVPLPDCGPRCGANMAASRQAPLRPRRHPHDPQALPPDVHIYVRSKLPWIALPGDAPAFEAYYDSGSCGPRRAWNAARQPSASPACSCRRFTDLDCTRRPRCGLLVGNRLRSRAADRDRCGLAAGTRQFGIAGNIGQALGPRHVQTEHR